MSHGSARVQVRLPGGRWRTSQHEHDHTKPQPVLRPAACAHQPPQRRAARNASPKCAPAQVESIDPVAHFCELVDNAIGAGAPQITISGVVDMEGTPLNIEVQDTGVSGRRAARQGDAAVACRGH